jgi:aspartate/methionine/tyrosine aminotransferase
VKYDIGESGIAPSSVKELLLLDNKDGSAHSIENITLAYNDVSGSFQLREEIAKTYTSCNQSNVMITLGATEANYLVFRTLLEPGDHVITQFPAYQQLFSVPEDMGCNVDYWTCRDNDDFKFEIADLERCWPTSRSISKGNRGDGSMYFRSHKNRRQTTRFGSLELVLHSKVLASEL